ncbi:O-antigen ligase family protein [Gymnodinialimonas ceratoperidinii]|uniref:O-antigen ligase family protein n=1 Tax=Gymnodinialimonas ceratoperidinii TaxID=2856823 RepID=A0A8F6TVH9_9RHOB|nr:O-antigen ligase family protein [Gymnodinialimonas ceratoperidinii]QXT39455.1 O-antigen ligase family protein [Gymnodinialimonas ceratoperidinii]
MRRYLRRAEIAFAVFGLFFMSGTLTAYLTPAGSESAPMVQLIGALIGLFSVVALLATPGSIARILTENWPAIFPVLFAVLTLAWSEDTTLTIRRSGSLGLTTAFAFWLTLRFSPKELFNLVIFASMATVLLNFAVIQVDPALGIHQAYDEFASHHAGSWRGLFGHKNDFGRVIALMISFLLLGFIFGTGGRYGRFLAVPLAAMAVLMIMGSKSSQAVLLATLVPAVMTLFLAMRPMSPTGRSLLLLLSIPVTIVVYLSAQLIFEYTLEALGRDATLTGRTVIWEGVLLALGGSSFAGGGYGAGWSVVGPRLTALTGVEVGHAHNGFLDLAVDVGFFGLGMTLLFMLWLGAIAFVNLMRGTRPEISALALTLVLFSFVGNVAGSFLLNHNSIFWLLLVATFAKLREAPIAKPEMWRERQSHDATAQIVGMRLT